MKRRSMFDVLVLGYKDNNITRRKNDIARANHKFADSIGGCSANYQFNNQNKQGGWKSENNKNKK